MLEIALTVTVPKPVYPLSAEIVCALSVGVTVLSWLLSVTPTGTSITTELNHLPEAGVFVPFVVKVLLVSVGTAATVIVPVV